MAFTKVVGAGIHTLSNITSHNIHSSGIVTATRFDGPFTNLNVTGVTTFAGDVSIGGTLTYEDVTNVDAVGFITAREGVFIPDNKRLELGNISGNGDLQIYHSGSHSFIQDEGTGNLYIDANQFYLRQANDDTVLFQTISNGEVRINHNGNLRLTTTNDGVDIGGTGSLKLPSGTTAQRNSSPTNGDLRYNTTTDGFEGYADGDWGPIGGVGAGGTWSSYTAGIATTKSVGINTNNLDDNDLVGIGNSFQGLYVSNGMVITDNKLNGNHYIGTAFNGLMAGPVTIEGTLTVDGNYVVV